MRRPVLATTAGLSLMLAVSALLPIVAAHAQPGRACFGLAATRVGTTGADEFWGSPRRDVVVTLGGNDVVHSSPGNDVLCGGAGSDRLTGGAGRDRLDGGLDRDFLRGGRGNDILIGNSGADELLGGPDRDLVTFAAAPSGIRADLAAGTARGFGHDTLARVESVVGSGFADTLLGSAAANTLRGLGATDTLIGRGSRDTLEGGLGGDTLYGGARPDALDGGLGTDGCVQGSGSGTKRRCEVVAFAELQSMPVFEPHRNTIGFGFHEALHGASIVLHPLGHLALNDNPSKYPNPRPPTDGPDYVVMGSRGRPTHPTSAIDLVVPSRAKMRAPVTGTVVAVDTYMLYCRIRDWKVYIRPQSHPDLRVLVLHMATPLVERWDKVVAGATVIGRTYQNDPSWAQENQYFPDQYPHVHVEIERKNAKKPPCAA